jgi:hypothetical protein
MQELCSLSAQRKPILSCNEMAGPHERLGRRRVGMLRPLWPLNLNPQSSMIAWLRRCYESIDCRKMYIHVAGARHLTTCRDRA